MKHLGKIVGLFFASMLMMGMAITSTASAAPHWLVCLPEHTGTTTTKWNSNQCATAAASGGWEWSELKGTEAVISKGSLLLKDTKTLAGVDAVECSGELEGIVGPGPFDKIAKINLSAAQCKPIEGCEEIERIEFLNLPFQTEVTEPKAGEFVDLLKGDGIGEPGYKVTCKVLGIKGVTDECKVAGTESLLLINKPTGTELLVLATFQHLRNWICTQSTATNKESGEVLGSLATLVVGRGLRVSS